MNKIKYYFYDTQTKIFCILFIILIVAIYFIIAIKFPNKLFLFRSNWPLYSIYKFNDICINLLYSLTVSILTYFLTVSFPTFSRLKKGYSFIHCYFKRQFIDSWVMLYCLLKYSLQVISSEADEDPYVKMYETENLREMKKLIRLNEFQILHNANKLIDNIEHFTRKLSSHDNLIPSSLYYDISCLDSDLILELRNEFQLLKENLSLVEVSEALKNNINTIDQYFKVLKKCETQFIGKKLMKKSKINSGIKLSINRKQ